MNEKLHKPQWAAKMYPGKTGRDHLGLGSVSSDQILPALSPGINVLTIHPRYHSFYSFLLYEYWQRREEKSRSDWIDFYRPRELIFSLGANLCEQEEHGEMGSIVGSQKTGSLASQSKEYYETDFKYIDADLGGYGLYYRTVMAEFGLIFPGGRGFPYPIDVPSPYGEEVALAFRETVKDTEYYQNYFEYDHTEVPIDVIVEYIHKACLCQLQVNHAPDNELLLDMFLHKGHQPENRRETFRLFLDIADQVSECKLTQGRFRQLLYFQETIDGYTYRPSDSVESYYIRWRLYQAREYYGYGLNALFNYLCDWGLRNQGAIYSIPIGEFWAHIEEQFTIGGISKLFGIENPEYLFNSAYSDLLDWLENLAIENEPSLTEPFSIYSPINEYLLYQNARKQVNAVDTMLVGMVLMLSLIYLRLKNKDFRDLPEWEISRMGGQERLSVDRFIKSVEKLISNKAFSVGDFIKWIYSDYVIRQHQFIATRKLPDNTFRFNRRGNELKFTPLENPLSFMDSRFEAISTTIHELGLSDDFGLDETELSSQGQKLLAFGDI